MNTIVPYATFAFRSLFIIALWSLSFHSDAQLDHSWGHGIGGHSDENVEGAALGPSGGHFITGDFFGVVDFDPSGNTSNLSSGGIPGTFLARYGPSGNYDWGISIVGNNPVFGKEVAVDPSGDIYVSGDFMDTADFDPSGGTNELVATGPFDVFLAKYDEQGDNLWAIKIDGVSADFGYGLTLDEMGNAYITGSIIGNADFDPGPGSDVLNTTNGSPDIFLAKYDPDGNYEWAMTVGGPTQDEGIAVSTDDNGGVYMTGYFQGTADFDPSGNTANLTAEGGEDAFIAKYDTAGNYQWAHPLGGSSNDEGQGIATGPSGQVYVGGAFQGTATFDPSGSGSPISSAGNEDIFITRFDTSGNYYWTRSPGGDFSDGLNDLGTDSLGSVWATGAFQDTVQFDPSGSSSALTAVGVSDIYLAGYYSTGEHVDAIGMGGFGEEGGKGVVPRKDGDLFLTGNFRDSVDFDPSGDTAASIATGGQDAFITRYDRCAPELLDSNNTICEGETFDLGGQTLDSAGTYQGILKGASGCDTLVTLDLAESVPDTSVASNEDSLFASPASSYQWLDCDSGSTPINGATSATFVPSTNGNYAVEVTDANGCTDTSNCHEVNTVGMEEYEDREAGLEVFPNPTKGKIWYEAPQEGVVKLFSSKGELLIEERVSKGRYDLDLERFPEGIYHLNWSDGESSESVPLILRE